MTEVSISLLQLIRGEIADALFNLHTGLPAKVASFDASKQSCSVKPTLKRIFLDNDGVPVEKEYPVISNVPIEYPNGGGWSITWPLAVGDTVYLSFCERSLDRWKDAPVASIVDPISNHRFDLTDAVARPGFRQRSNPVPDVATDTLRLASDDGATIVELSSTGVLVNGAMVNLGSPAAHPGVHGDVLSGLLSAIGVFATALAAANAPLTPAAVTAAATLTAATALAAALTVGLAIPPGPAGLLSAKVMLE